MLSIAPPRPTLDVYGTYGVLIVCANSGRVLRYQPEKGEDHAYSDIVKVDLSELRRHYGPDYVARFPSWDILDVGYWCAWPWITRGQTLYEPPAADHREIIADYDPSIPRQPVICL